MSIAPFKFDPKPASGSDLFFFDWTDWCAAIPGDALDGSTITVTSVPTLPSVLTISEISLNGYVVKCRIAGGTPNITYTVTCTVTSTPSARNESVDSVLYITR